LGVTLFAKASSVGLFVKSFYTKRYLAKKGYSKKYGARPITGVIRTYIKKVISRMIVAQNVLEGDHIQLDYEENSLAWEKIN
jgi:ATP-dependent Clp protease ATP-binding subunit ClpA